MQNVLNDWNKLKYIIAVPKDFTYRLNTQKKRKTLFMLSKGNQQLIMCMLTSPFSRNSIIDNNLYCLSKAKGFTKKKYESFECLTSSDKRSEAARRRKVKVKSQKRGSKPEYMLNAFWCETKLFEHMFI